MATTESIRRRIRPLAAAGLAFALAAPLAPPSAVARGTAGPPKGGSKVGISRRMITLGMHAPLTGEGSPLPSQSLDQGADIYFRWLRAKGLKINRRNVRVVLRNDNHNPAEAVEVCRELVEEEKVFAIVGFAGADQIQACARYAASVRVPYLAPGTTERNLANLPQTFATSMTWADQGPLMADFMVSKMKARKRKSAIVWMDTADYAEAKRTFVRAMRRKDGRLYVRSVPADANTTDAADVVQDLSGRSIKNVYVAVTPNFFMQLVKAAGNQNYDPRWTATDQTVTGGDTQVDVGCAEANPTIEGAKSFSAYPAFVDRDRFDKRYSKAMARFHPGDPGDFVVWGNWAQQKALARLLRRPGRNLTRKRFIWFAEHGKRARTGVGSRLRYGPNNHFGADQVHLLKASCDDDKWHTIKSFVSDF